MANDKAVRMKTKTIEANEILTHPFRLTPLPALFSSLLPSYIFAQLLADNHLRCDGKRGRGACGGEAVGRCKGRL